MKIKTLISLFVSILLLSYFTSCDSSSYEIEEFEVNKDTSTSTANTEIKQEIEQSVPELKEETTITHKPPVKYTIQIGAFEFESNAIDYIAKARSMFTYEFSYKLIDGLYKIRTGIYNTEEEAFPTLKIIRDAGFDDSFVREIGK
jgi:septal ring-binding cell division protein DamX